MITAAEYFFWHGHCFFQSCYGMPCPHQKRTREFVMQKQLDSNQDRIQTNAIDALLYLLTGIAMAIISVSFLLWLRF
jgi:hypothetical protein